jgi:DNA-binding sugar fermentation-stimulating protein
VTDQREIRIGDCVAVERVGQNANIRRVSAHHCDPAYAQAVRAVDDSVKAAAIRCEDAKQELAQARTIEAAELAIRKIDLLCN